MHAVSSMFVHFPLVPAWLCFRCCRKWSARKNFLVWLHSPNLCTMFRCSARMSHCGGLENSWPQYPHASVPLLEEEVWYAASTPDRAAHDQE